MAAADSTQRPYVKSFFATSVQEALQRAREEMGPDALLLNSRPSPPEARHLGGYEVVFGGSVPAPGSAPQPAEGIDEIKQGMEQIHRLLTRMTPSPAWQPPRTSLVEEALLAAGLDADLARDLADAVRIRVARRSILPISGAPAGEIDKPALMADVVAEIESRFAVSPELGRVAALIGPPGSGKTTTLVKLAIAHGLAAGRPVRLISADTYRIGGAEQLRTYAAILGTGFQAVESITALAQAIDSAPSEALVLIDTPGYSAAMLRDFGAELAAFLSARQDIDIHLVLTASMQPAALRAVAEAYAVFRPSKLLFTKLDEAGSFATALCEAVRQSRPLSFFGQGQAIPEDLRPASRNEVSESLVRQLPEALQAVA